MHPIEKLRRLWTPGREIEEVIHALDPQTELDSMRADLLHRVIQQTGPKTLWLAENGMPVLNSGTLRWEVIDHVGGRKEISIWVEGS